MEGAKMKGLIWFGCMLVFAALRVLLFRNLNLGAIGTALFALPMFLLAAWLCRKWDRRRANKGSEETSKEA
jgi:membrane protein implicated in regulation of membrane protease activity